MSRKNKKYDKQEDIVESKQTLPGHASPSAEASKTPEAEVLESAEKPQENISFEPPTAPAVLQPTEFNDTGDLGSTKEAFGIQKTIIPEWKDTDDLKDYKVLPTEQLPTEYSDEVVKNVMSVLRPEDVEEYVAGDIDLLNPGYDEIKTILSQWNFKHGTNFELKANILHDNGSSLLIDDLKKDLKDWYYNLVITNIGDGIHELIFA